MTEIEMAHLFDRASDTRPVAGIASDPDFDRYRPTFSTAVRSRADA